MSQRELVMIKNKQGYWEDIYNVGNTIDLDIVNESDAIEYVKQMYYGKFGRCGFIVDNDTDLYALLPSGFVLKAINPGTKPKGT